MTRHPTQRPGSWIPRKVPIESDGGFSDATSPSPTNICSKTDARLKVVAPFLAKVLCSTSVFVSFNLTFMSYSDTMKPPLSFLFEDKTHSSFSSTVKDKATSEPIRYNCFSVNL